MTARDRSESRYTHLDRAPDVLLRLALEDTLGDCSHNLIHILLQSKRVDILQDLVAVFLSYRLAHTLNQRGMPLERGVECLGRF